MEGGRLRAEGDPRQGTDPPALLSLGQIKSDKQQPGGVIYSIKGPGVDEEPLGIFSIDKFSGKVFLNAMLDREENDRFRVRMPPSHPEPPPQRPPILGPDPPALCRQLKAFALDLGGMTLEDPTDLEIIVVDQNDNRPLFRQDVFTGRVVEGAEPGGSSCGPEAGVGWLSQPPRRHPPGHSCGRRDLCDDSGRHRC